MTLRPIVYLVALIFATIWFGGQSIIAGLLGIERSGPYDRVQRGWGRTLLKAAGVKVETVGLEQVPTDRPVVFISNHQSWFDILALVATLPGIRFVAKKELTRVPVFGRAMVSAGHVVIDRQNRPAAFDAYERAAERIKAGVHALVFAEGTRSRTGELAQFKKGPFVLAIAAGAPIVPVYCAHTYDVLPKGSMWVRPRPITLYFGDPIPTEGLDYDDRERLRDESFAVVQRFREESGDETAVRRRR